MLTFMVILILILMLIHHLISQGPSVLWRLGSIDGPFVRSFALLACFNVVAAHFVI
jgi:hypothetical protein